MDKRNTEIRKRNNLRELLGNVPGLKPYEHIISELFDEFYSKDAVIRIEPLLSSSRLKQTPHNALARNFELIIGTKDRDPKEILWSIFHEYGHLQQDRPTLEESKDGTVAKYRREVDAWEIGQIRLLRFEELKSCLDNFQVYKLSRQSSYKIT